jgi:hypothetical protein
MPPPLISAKDFQAQYGRGATTTSAPASGKAPAKPSTKPKGPSPANALTAAVIELLQLRGFRAWRQNNGGVWDPTRQVFRANSSTPGISDVLAYHLKTGRFAAVEIKVGSDKLSDAQTAFLSDVIAAGGFGCECRSIAQLDRELTLYLSSLQAL